MTPTDPLASQSCRVRRRLGEEMEAEVMFEDVMDDVAAEVAEEAMVMIMKMTMMTMMMRITWVVMRRSSQHGHLGGRRG